MNRCLYIFFAKQFTYTKRNFSFKIFIFLSNSSLVVKAKQQALFGSWLLSFKMDEIVENVKMAREYALLGNYDTALVYFQGVLQQIQKHIVGIVDPVRKQKWHQVKAVYIFIDICA